MMDLVIQTKELESKKEDWKMHVRKNGNID